jgi:hypothetical protein
MRSEGEQRGIVRKWERSLSRPTNGTHTLDILFFFVFLSSVDVTCLLIYRTRQHFLISIIIIKSGAFQKGVSLEWINQPPKHYSTSFKLKYRGSRGRYWQHSQALSQTELLINIKNKPRAEATHFLTAWQLKKKMRWQISWGWLWWMLGSGGIPSSSDITDPHTTSWRWDPTKTSPGYTTTPANSEQSNLTVSHYLG